MAEHDQPSRWQLYCRLMRLNKPIGALLLLWPTLWALWLANESMPSMAILMVFIAGVVLMRAAGCVVNDFADRTFDGHVKRTANRPLATGEISERSAKQLFLGLVFASFLLVLTLNRMTILLSIAGLVLAWVYPFMKRITYLPQVVLGAAFGWSIPMAFAAVSEALPLECWLLFAANITWTVAYDTQYAMVDRDDDLKIGIKSTAILFGQYDKMIIGMMQLMTLGLLTLVAKIMQLDSLFYIALLVVAALFIYQQWLIKDRQRDACFNAFLNNNIVGFIIFIPIFVRYLPTII